MADMISHSKRLYIPPSAYKITTGTWTLTSASGIMYQLKTATAETSVVSIPVPVPMLAGEYGLQLTAIEVPIRVTGAVLTGVIAGSLYLVNDYKCVTASGVAIDTTAVTITETGTGTAVDSTGERLYTATVSSPSFPLTSTVTNFHYQLDLSLPCGASTIVRAYGASAVYNDVS